MRRTHLTAGLAVALAAALASPALAIPPIDDDGPQPTCPPGYHMEDGECVKNTPPPPPPPPQRSPVITMEIARQTTDLAGIRITGKATDADAPNTPLSVRITVDGVFVKTIVADKPDPPVTNPGFKVPPPVGVGHRYDTVAAAPVAAQQICAMAINVGSGHNSTVCRPIDSVTEFAANSLSYDLARAQISNVQPESLDRVTNTNATHVQQSTTVSGEKTIEETHGWTGTIGLKVSTAIKVGIPFFAEEKINIEVSASYEHNESTTTTRKFAWSQPVLVPPMSRVVAAIGVTKTTLTVPYTLAGQYVYESGVRVAGTTRGTFTGVNGHDLAVTLTQTNLDGTPAAKPVDQPPPAMLREG